MCSTGDVDLFTNVLPEHRPIKANTYSENKTHSHEGFKKEEEKKEGGREGGRKRPLFFKLRTELDCGRQEDAKCTRPLSPQGAARVAGRGRQGARSRRMMKKHLESSQTGVLCSRNAHWLTSWKGVAGSW